MKTIKTVLIVIFALTVSTTIQAKKVRLHYALEKGFEISFELSSTQEIAQELMGQSQMAGNKQVMAITYKVLDITSEGNYQMMRVITKVKILLTSPMGDMEFDSENYDENNPLSSSLAWLTETPLEFVMSPAGEILEVKNAEKIADEFAQKFSGAGPESQIVMALASQFASEDGLKQSVRMVLLQFPDKKVKVGTPWETISEVKQMISFVSTTSTMVNETNDNVASLTQNAKVEMGGEGDNTVKMQGMEMEYELSGSKQGAYEIDLATGLIIKGGSSTTISGIISIDSPQIPAPMTIPTTIKTTETVSRLK
ncbi:MAG: hypothetical protein KAH17_05715 [Bacteroidales bacterium]|nr:hypothetical protein [Bacteroidales bacterium]